MVDGIQPDVAMTTDVGVEDFRDEADERRPHGVTESDEIDGQTFINTVIQRCATCGSRVKYFATHA